jgi:4-amino-4-deoxy-L-arabinose transferase-like glycosyltransferase
MTRFARGVRPVGILLLAAGFVVVLLALVVAASALVGHAGTVRPLGPLGATASRVLAFGAMVVVGLLLVLGIVLVARRHATAALTIAGALFVGTRLAAVLALDGPLVSDWRVYHLLAIGWTLGAPPLANYPMGYPILLGEAYRLAGATPAVGELLNVVFAAVGAALLAAWVSQLSGRRAAAVAVAVLALAPSQVLYTVLLGTETLYCTAVIAIATLATRMLVGLQVGDSRRRVWLLALATGLALGASSWVRSTSLVLIPFLAILPLLVARRRNAGSAALAVVLGVAVTVSPVVLLNQQLAGRWSPSLAQNSGRELFMGMNLKFDGRRNLEDVALVNSRVPEYVPFGLVDEYSRGIFSRETIRSVAHRDEVALSMALDRIRDNGLAILGILPAKLSIAWSRGDSSVRQVFQAGPDAGPRRYQLARLAAQLWWVAALAGSLAWFALLARRRPMAGLVSSAILVPVALGLLVLAVHSRYHEYVVPLFACLSALTVTHLANGFRLRRRAAGRPTPGP